MISVSRARRRELLSLRSAFVLINRHCQIPTMPRCGVYYREHEWERFIRWASVNVTVVVFYFLLREVGSIFLNLNFQVEEAGRKRN